MTKKECDPVCPPHVAIIGSRDYPDPRGVITYILKLSTTTTIITGGDQGVAHWAEKTSRMIGLNLITIKPKIKPHVSWATACREHRTKIIETADRVVAFISEGDTSVVDEAVDQGKELLIIKAEEDRPTAASPPPDDLFPCDEHNLIDTTTEGA